jgi:hypothetical protein
MWENDSQQKKIERKTYTKYLVDKYMTFEQFLTTKSDYERHEYWSSKSNRKNWVVKKGNQKLNWSMQIDLD